MRTIEYASELDPLLEMSLPADWIATVVLEPGHLLSESDRPEDRLLGQLLSGGDDEKALATQLRFLYYRGIDPDRRGLSRDNQISVSYDIATEQYELSTRLAETTVHTPNAAADWIDDQFIIVETFVDTYRILIDRADDIHGLGRTGVRELVETFETLDAIREADVGVLAEVPYVDTGNATALQTALDDLDGVDDNDPTTLELTLRTHDGPLILDLQEGPISGELVPSGASEPKFASDGFGPAQSENDNRVI